MDMIQKHQEVLKKPIVYYHRFLNAYSFENANDIYIFCEGDVDLSYYGEQIDRLYQDKNVKKYVVECKNNVLQIRGDIDWKIYDAKRVLFFVDRDFSYWLKEDQEYGDNVYVTDGYSIENDAVNLHMFMKCIEDHYGFANCTANELDIIKAFYQNRWSEFVQGSYEVMAYALLHQRVTNLHKATNIKMTKCISFDVDGLWLKEIDGVDRTNYYQERLEMNGIGVEKDIEQIIQEFKNHSEHYSIRGKWCLGFFVMALEHVMNNAQKYAASLYDGCDKPPKRLLNLSERGAMAILGPKINAPDSLLLFLERNLGGGTNEK